MTIKIKQNETNVSIEKENTIVRVVKNTLRVSIANPPRIVNVKKNVNRVSVRQFGSITIGGDTVYYPTGWI